MAHANVLPRWVENEVNNADSQDGRRKSIEILQKDRSTKTMAGAKGRTKPHAFESAKIHLEILTFPRDEPIADSHEYHRFNIAKNYAYRLTTVCIWRTEVA